MNCESFETIVSDLARGNGMDAVARGHVENCERCALRLADERALMAGLRALSVSEQRNTEPDTVEAALRAAFRAEVSRPNARPLPLPSWRWPRWAWAAAAVMLIACGLIVYRNLPTASPQISSAVNAPSPTPQPFVNRAAQMVENVATATPHPAAQVRRQHRSIRPRPNAPFVPEIVIADAKDSEDATEFIPLRFGNDNPPMESGEVIRVQMSRASLIALGLPVTVERADETIKADLLIGEDGQARAIRFVR